MTNSDLALHSEYLFKLLRAALNGESVSVMPGSLPEYIDLKRVFYLANLHSVAPTVYPAIKNSPLTVVKLFEDEFKKSWKKNAVQYVELSLILSKTNEFGINCIPLKGSVIKNLYPSPEMRTMSDIDLLYDHRKLQDVLLIMYTLGYTTNLDSPNHHTFLKEPVMNVEFHQNLFKDDFALASFFNPGWRYSRHTGKGMPLRELTNEGFYIYLIAHITQHFMGGGVGIRSIMDVWVFLKQYNTTLDWRYINQEFRRANIFSFAENIRTLAEMWFGAGEKSLLLTEFGDYILKSGTFGLRSNQINSELNKDGKHIVNKLKYIAGTIFPPYKIMKESYPLIKKVPVLLPFGWITRDFSILLKRKQDVKFWIETVAKTKENTVKEQKELFKKYGLK